MNNYVITVLKYGRFTGYIKSISYNNSTFQITQKKQNARKFTEDEAMGEIDYLTSIAYSNGFIFGYDE